MASPYAMAKEDHDVLRKNLTFINENMEPKPVLDYLYQEKIFTKQDIEDISVLATKSDQNREIVMRLMKKGPNAFEKFIICLMETEQKPVAQRLDKHGFVDEWCRQKDVPEQRIETDSQIPIQVMTESSSTGSMHAMQETIGIQTHPKTPIESLIIEFNMLPVKEEDVKHLINDRENVYIMSRKCRGRVIIINNETFADESRRHGSDADVSNLRKLFGELHFSVYEEKNKTAQDMRYIIGREAANTGANENSDCFILFVLSHGGHSHDNQDYVLGTDKQRLYIKSEIVAPFYGDKCPSLKGKPKLIFIQACRSVKNDEPDMYKPIPETGSSQDLSQNLSHELFRQLSITEPDILDRDDVFCIYSTVKGHKAPIYTHLGSPFVRQIVTIFSGYAHTHSLLQMLVKVNNRLKEDNVISEVYFTAGKELYFFPGYFVVRQE